MNHFNHSQDFMDLQNSSWITDNSLMGQHTQQISRNQQLSQTFKRMHQDTPHYEQSLEHNNTSFNSNNKWAPDFSQNISADRINANEHTYMMSASVSEPGSFPDENQNENKRVNSLSNSNSSRLKCDRFYSVQKQISENYGQCSRHATIGPSTNKQSNRPDERIHKWSFQRQHSTTIDIGFGVYALTQNTCPDVQASTSYKHGAPQTLDSSWDSEENNLQPLLRGSPLDNCSKNCLDVSLGLTQSSQQPSTGMSDNSFFNEQNSERGPFSSGCPETFVGKPTQTNPEQLMSLLCKDCSHNLVDAFNTLPERKRTERTAPVKFEILLGKDRARQGVDCFGKDGGKACSWLSVTKKDVAMCIVILLLAFGVFHLHRRVDAVERSCTRGCSCVTGSETGDRDAASLSLQAGNGDVSTHAIGGLGTGLRETHTVDGGDSSKFFLRYFNNKTIRDEKMKGTKVPSNEHRKNIPRTQSSNSDFDGFESMGTDQETPLVRTEGRNSLRNYIFQTTLNVSSLGETHAVEGNTTEVRVADSDVHPSSSSVKAGGGRRSRRDAGGKAQSGTHKKPTKVKDQNFAENKRKGDKKARTKNKLQSNSEVYEARLSEIFPYSINFRSKECVTHTSWDKSIEACKEEVVKLHHKHSVLPFYLATNETASKHPDQRMLMMSNDTPGEFKVNIPGDYLVQLNIYIVVDNPDHDHKHFLALYHNGEAKLACHQGGFRCPHLNHDRSNKYKICNIIGLLELKKNDTVDIRTMDGNMKVRMEKQHNTYFRVMLLNKRT